MRKMKQKQRANCDMVVSHRPPVFPKKTPSDSPANKALRLFLRFGNPLTYSPESAFDFAGKPKPAPSPFGRISMPYQPLYHWRRTKLDENDVASDSDWSGYDGEIGIGRIQLQDHSAMKGRWLWAAHGPHVRHRHTPHTGYEVEGREAMRKVEEYYHALMAANGMKGSRQG